MNFIQGGVCASKGFSANGVHCGIRKGRDKKDLALIFSTVPASSAATYTTNLVKGAPLTVTKNNIEASQNISQAVICNSGYANTCNADGIEIAQQMCNLAAEALNIDPSKVIVGSTGIIGQQLSIEPIKNGIHELVSGLENSQQGNDSAAEAIMTTDTIKKEAAIEFNIGGSVCHIGGIAKGSGMIHPNMATMLVFITSDVAITGEYLQKALSMQVPETFNMISIDGDTSTNDMAVIMANGMAENDLINSDGENFDIFCEALNKILVKLSRTIASDGEGATRLLECKITGAQDHDSAKTAAKSVICSNLFKAAMFGADANWGRVLCALGYSGVQIDPLKVDVTFRSPAGEVEVCKNGTGLSFSEDFAKQVLNEKEIEILVNLNLGNASATAWGCDLTYDYVKINGSYRS